MCQDEEQFKDTFVMRLWQKTIEDRNGTLSQPFISLVWCMKANYAQSDFHLKHVLPVVSSKLLHFRDIMWKLLNCITPKCRHIPIPYKRGGKSSTDSGWEHLDMLPTCGWAHRASADWYMTECEGDEWMWSPKSLGQTRAWYPVGTCDIDQIQACAACQKMHSIVVDELEKSYKQNTYSSWDQGFFAK